MADTGRLVVLGATGSTGSRVAALAADAGVPTVVVGRRREALEQLALGTAVQMRVSTLDPRALDGAIAGADVVVNGIGPYSAYGRPVVDAAIRAGAHYVDFSGEPRWVHAVATEYAPEAAKRGVRLVPSVGLGAAGDLAAALVSTNLAEVDSLTIAYRIVGMKPSAATAQSTIDILTGGAPLHHPSGNVTFSRAGTRSGRLPGGRGVGFPTPDAIALGARWPRARIESFMQSPVPAISGTLLAATASLLCRERIARAARAGIGHWAGAEHHGHGGRATATAVGEGSGRRATAAVHVHDVYDFTARAGLAAALGLLAGAGEPGLQSWGQVTGPPFASAAELGASIGAVSSDSVRAERSSHRKGLSQA